MSTSVTPFQDLFDSDLKPIAYFLDKAFMALTLKEQYETIALQLVPLLKNEERLDSFREERVEWSNKIEAKYAAASSRENLLKESNWDKTNDPFVIYELFLQIASCWQEELLREDTGNGLPSPTSWRVQRQTDYDLRDVLRYHAGVNSLIVRAKEPRNHLQQEQFNVLYNNHRNWIKIFGDELFHHLQMNKQNPIYSIELKLSDSHNKLILVVKNSSDDIGCFRLVRELNDSCAPQKYFIKSFEEIGNKVDVRDWGKSQNTQKIWGKDFPKCIGDLFFQKLGSWETVLKRKRIILKDEPDININKLKKEIDQLVPYS